MHLGFLIFDFTKVKKKNKKLSKIKQMNLKIKLKIVVEF